MGAVVVGPVLLSLVWGQKQQNRRAQILLALIVVIGAVGYVTDQLAYHLSSDWADALLI